MRTSNPIAFLIASLAVVAHATAAFAQTDVPAGTLPVDELTWSAAGSPYRIADGDVLVPDGYQLAIGAGVRVELGASRSIEGSLEVEGTAVFPVVFTRLSPGNVWGSLKLPAGITSRLIHARVEGAITGVQSSSDSVTIEDSVFTDNVVDVLIGAGLTQVYRSRFEGTVSFPGSSPQTGIAAAPSAALAIVNSIVSDKIEKGIFVSVTTGSPPSGIHNSTFVRNEVGIQVISSTIDAWAPDVKNVIVTGGDVGFSASGPEGFVIHVPHSNIWGHETRDYDPAVEPGAGFISEDPLFVGPDDFHLSPLSPSVDTGTDLAGITGIDFEGTARPQGNGWDMGAYETRPRCGDGAPSGSEECDDGNVSNADACTNNCKSAACGDGILQRGVEECDDGNANDADGCNASCERALIVDPKGSPGSGGCTVSANSSQLPTWMLICAALVLLRRKQARK